VWAGDPKSRRWSPLEEIRPANVDGLHLAWTWEVGENRKVAGETGDTVAPGKFEATPLAFGDTLILSTPFNRVVALDGRTGEELWSFDPGAADRGLIANDHAGFVHRGVATWAGPSGRRILLPSRWELIALDAATGRPVPEFGTDGRVDLAADLRWPVNRAHYGNTSPPVVAGDLVVVGSAVGDGIIHEQDPPGDVQAFDVRTGERRWTWSPLPPAGTQERSTWGGKSGDITGHVNVWAPMSVDEERGLLFLPVSAPSNDWYGGRRPGDNLFSQSVVCLDVQTGRRVWHRQIVRHGLWDYDPPAAPTLARMARGGDSVDVVVLAGKTGYLYVMDRETGQPVWPWEDRPAPASGVPGEVPSPTQPHPTWPEPFAAQGISTNDLVDFTPEIRALALEKVRGHQMGPMFTPPSLEGTVVLPGWIGGAGWGGVAVDPERRLLLVKGTNRPVLARLVPTGDERRFRLDSLMGNPARALEIELPRRRRWVFFESGAARFSVVKPPWGTLTAYDLDTGAKRWERPLGDTPEVRDHPDLRHLELPPLGVAGAPGALVTRSGLTFITGGGESLLALETLTGRTLWSAPLGRIGYSNPMTYRTSDGRQYVVVATGVGAGARLQAFTVPHDP
jgi:quinoprotein glucose dehydrogenase